MKYEYKIEFESDGQYIPTIIQGITSTIKLILKDYVTNIKPTLTIIQENIKE